MRRQRSMWNRAAIAGVGALLLSGCTLHYEDLATGRPETFSLTGQSQTQRAAVVLPPDAHLRCGAISYATMIYQVPGDVNRIIGPSNNVVAQTGIVRHGWMLIVNTNGIVGWVNATWLPPYQELHRASSAMCARSMDASFSLSLTLIIVRLSPSPIE